MPPVFGNPNNPLEFMVTTNFLSNLPMKELQDEYQI